MRYAANQNKTERGFMNKWTIFFLLFVCTIFCTFTAYVYNFRADFLSHALGRELGVQVKMKSVDFSEQGLKAKGVRIHNPSDCVLKNALVADKVTVKMDPLELFKAITGIGSERVVIRQIKIEKPEMHMEFFTKEAQDNNWTRILANIAQTKNAPASRQFEIMKLTLTEVKLEVKYHVFPKTILHPSPVAKIELTNIGREQPATPKEVFYTLFTKLVDGATNELGLNHHKSHDVAAKAASHLGAKQK